MSLLHTCGRVLCAVVEDRAVSVRLETRMGQARETTLRDNTQVIARSTAVAKLWFSKAPLWGSAQRFGLFRHPNNPQEDDEEPVSKKDKMSTQPAKGQVWKRRCTKIKAINSHRVGRVVPNRSASRPK